MRQYTRFLSKKLRGKLEVFRLEVVRFEFKKVWGAHVREIILNIVRKIFENVVEDSRLLAWYDPSLGKTQRD